jgi:type IV pilus assembly protein PilO
VSSLPSSQQDQAKLAAGVVAAALAVYYYMYPHATRAADIEARAAKVEALETANNRARLQARKGSATRLAAEAARIGASLDAMQRLVPTVHEVPALLEEVSTAARRAGLDIGGVSPEPVIGGPEFDTYRYRVSLVGGYHAVATFLANVGSLPRIVAPVTFQLAPATRGGARVAAVRTPAPALEATLTIQTYVAHVPAGAAGRGSSAGETLALEAQP